MIVNHILQSTFGILNHMRYLGIDYGDKRIGLAISDPDGKIAIPRQTIDATKSCIKTITEITAKEKVGMVIIGLPITFSGKESHQTLKVKKFANELRRIIKIPLDFQNEILTTKLAERSGTAKDKIDASSAAIILQDYLDKQR